MFSHGKIINRTDPAEDIAGFAICLNHKKKDCDISYALLSGFSFKDNNWTNENDKRKCVTFIKDNILTGHHMDYEVLNYLSNQYPEYF